MSLRTNILLVLALAVGLAYGRFVVPWLLTQPAEQQEPEDPVVAQKIEDEVRGLTYRRLRVFPSATATTSLELKKLLGDVDTAKQKVPEAQFQLSGQ